MALKSLLISCLCIFIGGTVVFGQDQKPPETENEYEKAYQRRIQQELLHNVYIPKDLADAFIQLNKLIDPASKMKYKTMPEEEAVKKLYFSFGRWIIHNWGFYGGSRLSHHLKSIGLHHPDDMSKFIMITYHRNLNRQKLRAKDLVEDFQAARKKEYDNRLKNGTIIHTETRKRNQ